MSLEYFVVMLFASLSAAVFAQTPQDVPKPGTVLVYQEEVNGAAARQIRVTLSEDSFIPGTGVCPDTVDGRQLRHALCHFSRSAFPLAVGKGWEHGYFFKRNYKNVPAMYRYGGDGLFPGYAKVVKEDTRPVGGLPATKTFQVDFEGHINRMRSAMDGAAIWTYKESRWYAPDLGIVVKTLLQEFERTGLLVTLTYTLVEIKLPPDANSAAAPASAAAPLAPAKE